MEFLIGFKRWYEEGKKTWDHLKEEKLHERVKVRKTIKILLL